MFKTLKKRLEKIRNSDEAIRKRWLIVSSAATITIVIVFWAVYINWAINATSNQTERPKPEIDFWQIFQNGLIIIANQIKVDIKTLASEITKERTVIIKQ